MEACSSPSVETEVITGSLFFLAGCIVMFCAVRTLDYYKRKRFSLEQESPAYQGQEMDDTMNTLDNSFEEKEHNNNSPMKKLALFVNP